MSKVLIAGGTGYIGTATVKAALDSGLTPVVLTRSEEKAEVLRKKNIEVVIGDLLEKGEWQEVAKSVEYAVFLASPPTWGKKVTRKIALAFQKGHEEMTKKFLDAFISSSIKKIIYIAGTSYYGDTGNGTPKKEEDTNEPKGWGPYIAPSVKLLSNYISKGLPIVTAFPGQVYGPDSWMQQLFLNPIYQGKPVTGLKGYNPMFSPIHIDDCGRAIIHLLTNGMDGERYILVDDLPIPSHDFRNLIGDVMQKTVRTREVPRWLCNILLGPVLTEYATAHTNFSNEKLKAAGFVFEYPTYREGIPQVVNEWIEKQKKY